MQSKPVFLAAASHPEMYCCLLKLRKISIKLASPADLHLKAACELTVPEQRGPQPPLGSPISNQAYLLVGKQADPYWGIHGQLAVLCWPTCPIHGSQQEPGPGPAVHQALQKTRCGHWWQLLLCPVEDPGGHGMQSILPPFLRAAWQCRPRPPPRLHHSGPQL